MRRSIRRFLLGENMEPQKHLSKLEGLELAEMKKQVKARINL